MTHRGDHRRHVADGGDQRDDPLDGGRPTGFNGLTVFAQDPLSGFVITGNNTAGNGPPITSDADYASLCLTSSPPGFQPTRGVKWLYGAPGHSMYNHRRPAQRQAVRLPGRPAAQRQVGRGLAEPVAERHLAEPAPRRRQLAVLRRPRPVHQGLGQRRRPGRRWAAATAARSSRPTVSNPDRLRPGAEQPDEGAGGRARRHDHRGGLNRGSSGEVG